MENPHEAEQTVLLERIIRNVDKCNEAVVELNHCVKEILESSVCVEQAAELSQYYSANAANYLRTIKQLPDPA